ncbi:MAG: DUF1080 domain-containing protein [Verrucomicrobia bacterium]|nr:DUF1080 domain-containing protein [Verrucomicrobiota bacterium]
MKTSIHGCLFCPPQVAVLGGLSLGLLTLISIGRADAGPLAAGLDTPQAPAQRAPVAFELAAATAAGEAKASAALPALEGAGWKPLFDGHSLAGWKVVDFAGHGEVEVKEGNLVLEMGAMLTGVNLVKTNDLPKTDYELALEVMRVDGSDFFCGLTFVVGDSCCSFIVGGWGGGVVGISSIDDNDASLNETTKYMNFESKRWYRIRVRVTPAKLEAWIDREKMVDVKLEGKRIGVRLGEIELSQPFGIATYQTTAAVRNVQWRRL